jgi:hypothetical protein
MPAPATVTFFTVVMNRLHHLAITLPANMRDCSAEGTQFLILDYGSSDGVANYLHEKFPEEMSSGRLLYERTEATYFERSRSRNMAARLTGSEFICNIDADNFTGAGFDRYVLDKLHPRSLNFLTALNDRPAKDTIGKIALRRSHFFDVGGYDESFDGYGFEDYDLVKKLEDRGLRKRTIENQQFLQAISHSTLDRIGNEWRWNNLYALYTQQVNANTRVLLFLYRNQSLEYGLVLENPSGFKYSLVGKKWQPGHWNESTNKVHLTFSELECYLDRKGNLLCGGNHFLTREKDPEKIREAVLFNTEIANRYRLNAVQKPKTVNI